jgi:hypothetical protein
MFLIFLLISYWKLPALTPWLSMIFLVVILGVGISTIFSRHKGQENARAKISKDVLILVLTILLISFLGGLAGLFANQYATMQFGQTAGFISALAAGLLMGYLVNRGMRKLMG